MRSSQYRGVSALVTKPKLTPVQRGRHKIISWYWRCIVNKVNRLAYLRHMLAGVPVDELCDFPEEIEEVLCLESRGWPKRGYRVHLRVDDIPLPEGQSSHWGLAFDGEQYILSESLRRFKEKVEEKEYEHRRRDREGREMLIKWVTAVAALIAAAASLVNLFLASHHK